MTKLLALLLGGAKFGKLLPTAGSMLLSIGAYALMFGWRYAVGFVLLIFVHEMGHYIAALRRGLDVGAPMFIPFVGAWVELKSLPHDAETEAYVGLGGPFIGTLGALVCFGLAREFDSSLLLALAYAGFFLNLFNLIPLSPLDGGRITAVLTPRIWLVGVPVLIGLFIRSPNVLLVLIAVMAAPKVLEAWRGITTPEQQQYYAVDAETRVTYGAAYIGLVIFLALMCHELHEELPRATPF